MAFRYAQSPFFRTGEAYSRKCEIDTRWLQLHFAAIQRRENAINSNGKSEGLYKPGLKKVKHYGQSKALSCSARQNIFL